MTYQTTMLYCVNWLGAWNVQRIHGIVKREEVVYTFKKGKFKLLTLIETKLKRNGEISWCGVYGIIANVQKMEKARKGVSVPLNDVAQCCDRLQMC